MTVIDPAAIRHRDQDAVGMTPAVGPSRVVGDLRKVVSSVASQVDL